MAFITFHERYNGRLAMVVSPAKAAKIMDMLDNPPDDITEEQGAFLVAIKKIYPGSPLPAAPHDAPGVTDPWFKQTQGKAAASGKD